MVAPPDPSGSRVGGSLGGAAPAWLSVPVLLAVAALAGALVPGLLLATQGWFVPSVGGPVMALGAVGAAWAAWPAVRPRGATVGRAAHAAAVVALVGLAGLSSLNVGRTGQWVLTDRDPGVAITAAGWLAEDGALDAPAAPGAFSSVDWADGATAQGWSREGARAQPQFMHGAPVALATARWIGGDGAMLHLNAVFAFLAGLCLFVLATRFMPGWAAAGAALSLLVLAPQMFVARAAFSEVPAQLLLIGGAALLLGAVESGARRALVVAGMTAAAVVLVRIDGALALAGIGPWLAARAVVSRRDTDTPTERHTRPGREAGGIALGMAAVALVAVLDAIGPASEYVRFHRSEIASQLTLSALAWFGAFVVYRILVGRAIGAHVARSTGTRPRRLAAAGVVSGGAVLATVAALWWIRPVVELTREAVALDHVAVLQAAENLAVDPTRRYFEDSMRWFSWYLGPIGLVFAAAALAVAVGTWVAGRSRDPCRLLVVALAGVPTAVFVWRARTTPDQLWVLRRFVPTTLPFLVALAWAAIAGLGPLVARRRPRWRRAALPGFSVLAAVAVVFPLVATTWPLRDMTLQDHALDAVDATCDALGPDAAALALADEGASLILPATLRFACEVPVAGATRPVRADELGGLAERWAAEGRRLVVVGGTEASLTDLLGDVAVRRFEAAGSRQPRATIGRPPGGLKALTVSWALAEVPRPGPVDGRNAADRPA